MKTERGALNREKRIAFYDLLYQEANSTIAKNVSIAYAHWRFSLGTLNKEVTLIERASSVNHSYIEQ